MQNEAILEPIASGSTPVSSPSATSPAVSFKVYRPNDTVAPTPEPELPESYFTPTAADLQSAQSTLSAKTANLVNAPLQLRAVKDAAERKKRLERFPNTRVRVKFTDRTQLEKSFPSTDKIRSIYAFVRGSLREDAKSTKFVLYQPPNRVLKVSDLTVRDQTLSDLQLSPSSLLLLRFENDAMNMSGYPAPLSAEVLALAEDLPAPLLFDSLPAVASSGSSGNGTNSAQKPKSEKKIPKWLQAGMRK